MDQTTSSDPSSTWVRDELGRLSEEIKSWPAWMQQLASREVGRLEPESASTSEGSIVRAQQASRRKASEAE